MRELIHIVEDALMITGFVFVMMLVIEYVNVRSKGRLGRGLENSHGMMYVITGLLGSIPGCLGSFTVVSLYSHRIIPFGALVTTMLATTGDAAFLMLAMFPAEAMKVFAILLGLGIIVGGIVDLLFKRPLAAQPKNDDDPGYAVHEDECCTDLTWSGTKQQWRHCSLHRGALVFFLALFFLGVAADEIGHYDQEWMRITVLVTVVTGLAVVATVPDHFLEEHLWDHVAKKHAVRIFLWTLAAIATVHILTEQFGLEDAIEQSNRGRLILLLVACLVGLIPDSSPHYVFVALFANGSIPFSILLASSIVQDGHGMLPMLAHSRRGFLAVKAINMTVGLVVGYAVLLAGW